MKPFRTSLCLLLLLSLAFGCASCKRNADKPESGNDEKAAEAENGEDTPVKKETPFLTPVLVEVAERGEIAAVVSTTGSIIPVRSQALRTQEAGRIFFERTWKEGDRVEKDAVIATLSSLTLDREILLNQADVDLQEENLDIARRTLDARRRDFETLQDLYARGVTAKREVDSAELELDRAENSFRQSQINLEKAKTTLTESLRRRERLVVRAPYDGLLVSRATLEGTSQFSRGFGEESITDYEGQEVSANHFVCGIVDTSTVFMRCDVTSKDVGRIRMGQDARITIYASEDIERSGEAARISESVNPDTRAFEVDIRIDNAGLELKPGMFGRAEVIVERRRDRIRLPKEALTRRNNKDVVFVAEDQPDTDYQVARMIPVELGLEGKEDVEVSFGIESGELVVVRGFEVLQDKTPIKAIDAGAPITPAYEEETGDSGAGAPEPDA